MKSKKLLLSTLLLLGGITTYLTMSSYSGGIMGVSSTGCGGIGCHALGATNITITGIPATGFTSGSTYTLTLRVTNTTKVAAGFDLSVTAGALSGAPTGTMLMGGNELHHTTPKSMTAGTSEWIFNWTAPATATTAEFKVAGNAVNLNTFSSGDAYAVNTISFSKAWPTNVANVENTDFQLYPNPANEFMILKSANGFTETSFNILSLNGSVVRLNGQHTRDQNECRISTASLPAGHYILYFESNGKTQSFPFRKN